MSPQEQYTTIRKIEISLIDGRKKLIYPVSGHEQLRTMERLKEAIRKEIIFEYNDIIIPGRSILDVEASTQRVKVPERWLN